LAGVADAEVDLLPSDGDAAAAADPPLDPHRFDRGCRWWAGGAGVADAGLFRRVEWVGQAAQRCAIEVEEVQDTAVEAGDDASAGEVVADRVLSAGKCDQAVAGDDAVDLDRLARLDGSGDDGWRSSSPAAVGEEPVQVRDGEPGRDGLEADAVQEQVHHGGVRPQSDAAGA
jgi:hypothetical protein